MARRLKNLFLASLCILTAAMIFAASSQAQDIPAQDIAADAHPSPEAAQMTIIPVAEEEHKPEEAHETAADIGFPQLKPDSYASQVFWLVISFAVLYVMMSKIALPRITEVIDMRNTQKNGNLSRAEQLQEEAAKVRSAYEGSLAKAQETAHGAMTETEENVAEKIAAENAKFSDHARKRIVTAEQNIAKAKSDALSSLADISAEIAADIVHKITDVQIAKADAKKAVLAEMQKG